MDNESARPGRVGPGLNRHRSVPARTRLVIVFAGALALAFPLGAQSAQGQEVPGLRIPVAHVQGQGGEVPWWPNRILTAVAGGVLGAGLGFFASQVMKGDWEDGPGQGGPNRPLWATVGGALGTGVGISFPLRSVPVPRLPRRTPPPRHLIITAQEIRDIVAMNAYEAVRLLRPQWLVERPSTLLRRPDPTTRTVYLDDFRLGGVEELRGVSTDIIASIRLVSRADATARQGVGNLYGAIQVVTR